MEQIIPCPHCGNETTQEVIFETSISETFYLSSDPDDSCDFDITYYLTKCITCNSLSLFYDAEFYDNQGNLSEATLCYPEHKKLGIEIPSTVANTYREASRIRNISSEAFAVMIRRGLEFLCQDKKAKGETLKNQLEDLGSKGIIPNTLVEMGDALRFLGNIGAHATNYKIDRTEIKVMDDFFLAMLEYVYIAPAKLTQLKESIKKKTK
jgi:hypothetical protein